MASGTSVVENSCVPAIVFIPLLYVKMISKHARSACCPFTTFVAVGIVVAWYMIDAYITVRYHGFKEKVTTCCFTHLSASEALLSLFFGVCSLLSVLSCSCQVPFKWQNRRTGLNEMLSMFWRPKSSRSFKKYDKKN